VAQVSPDELAEQLRRLSLATTQYAAALARAMNLGMSEVLAMQHLYKGGSASTKRKALTAKGLDSTVGVIKPPPC